MFNTSTAVLSLKNCLERILSLEKKKWDANNMAAATNHWINDVEQMESTLGRLLENMGCQRSLILAAQVFIDSVQFFIISTLKNYTDRPK